MTDTTSIPQGGTDEHSSESRRFPISAVAMLSIVAVLFAGAVTTLISHPAKFRELHEKHDARDLLQGRTTLEAEDVYEDLYALEEPAVGLWGALRYMLFRTGNPGVLIGDQEWLYTTEEFEAYKEGREELNHKLETIGKVNDYLHRHNVQLIVLLVPAKARVYPDPLGDIELPKEKKKLYPWFQGSLLERGIYAPDFASIFLDNRDSAQLFMRTDTHWTPQGAELTASALERFMARDCRTLNLEHTNFKTRVSNAEHYAGDLMKFVPTGWFGKWVSVPKEPLRRRETVKEEDAPEDALFAEERIPVVLVGTSYSAHEQWNFEGALKTALQSDVMNMAQEGGGPMQPMADYLKEADLIGNPPQLVVWEIPERFLEKPYKDVTFTFPNEETAGTVAASHCNLDRLRWQRGQY